jgi:hypothetical protein
LRGPRRRPPTAADDGIDRAWSDSVQNLVHSRPVLRAPGAAPVRRANEGDSDDSAPDEGVLRATRVCGPHALIIDWRMRQKTQSRRVRVTTSRCHRKRRQRQRRSWRR